MTEFYIPASLGESEFTEKRSRFLGHVRHISAEDEARAFIAAMKKEYYDARHNCWCYSVRGGAERYSDDGEPQGTAGIPMLEVFRREGVTDFVCVVTRYFGGVLLGTGGLLRAYTKSAADALRAGGVSVVRRWVRADVPCSYSMAEKLRLELTAMGAAIEDTEYGAGVVLKALIPEELFPGVSARIFDLSAGAVTPVPTGDTMQAVKVR